MLTIGMIGLDTSHVEHFANIIMDKKHPYHIKGVKISHGVPYPSEDLDLSINRVEQYSNLLKLNHVELVGSLESTAHYSDGVIMAAVDGRKHLEMFEAIAPYQKPVFIDKPLTLSIEEAEKIYTLSEQYGTPIMSTSALRYADSVTKLLHEKGSQPTGVYLSGPIPIIEHFPGYYWYGIHMIELLLTIMGTDYKRLHVTQNRDYEMITTEFEDGRFGVIRGDHDWHGRFEATIHFQDETVHIPIYKDRKSFYVSLLEQIISFFRTGNPPIKKQDTLSVLRFIETANQLRDMCR